MFSVVVTFADFQLVYILTRGGPNNETHLLATLAYQLGMTSGNIGQGRRGGPVHAADPGHGDRVPALVSAPPGRALSAWAGIAGSSLMGSTVGETYLKRLMVFYIPLFLFVFAMLFPFLWMFITSIKPDPELYNPRLSPFLVREPTLSIGASCSTTPCSSMGDQHLLGRVRVDRDLAVRRRARGLRARPADLPRLDGHRHRDLRHLPGAAHAAVHPADRRHLVDGPAGHDLVADLHLSDLCAVLHLAADGLLPDHPQGARGVRPDRRRDAHPGDGLDHPAARRTRHPLAGIFAFTLSWNEFLYAPCSSPRR